MSNLVSKLSLKYQKFSIISKHGRTNMPLKKRQEEILAIINQEKSVKVEDLSLKYDVTEQSIRRDLNQICSRGLAIRIHGGARIVNSISNLAYEKRRLVSSDSKIRIGKMTAELIPNDCSLMMNIGSTSYEIVLELQYP